MPSTGATATFRVVSPGEFRGGGFRCTCGGTVGVGQPYGSALDGMTGDGEPIVELLCASRATGGGSHE